VVVDVEDTARTRPRWRRRPPRWSAVLILAAFVAGAATLLYLAFRPGSTGTLDPAQEAVRRYVENPEDRDRDPATSGGSAGGRPAG
jgi:hypothetical protein